jgi:hypothetical protein
MALLTDTKLAHKRLAGIPEFKTPLGANIGRLDDSINMDLKVV